MQRLSLPRHHCLPIIQNRLHILYVQNRSLHRHLPRLPHHHSRLALVRDQNYWVESCKFHCMCPRNHMLENESSNKK